MSTAAQPDIAEALRVLRLKREFAKARELIRSQPAFGQSPALQRLLHEHEDFWWAPVLGKRVTLRRRSSQDLAFVRACWADAVFMRKFNRLARPLPSDDRTLAAILDREHASLFSESRAIHWTAVAGGEAIGFLSATEYMPGHRRCEFLIGLLDKPASPVPVEATHLAVDFLHERAGVERLTAYFYAENIYASKVAAKFGFKPEGVLRGYNRNPDGSREDLMVSGLLVTDGEYERTKQVRRRLFARANNGRATE